MPPTLVFFFNITFAIRGLFWFHTNFRIVCSSSVKNAGVVWIGTELNMQIDLGSSDILTIFVLPIHEYGNVFPFFCVFFNFFHKLSIVFSVQISHLFGQVYSQVFYCFWCNCKLISFCCFITGIQKCSVCMLILYSATLLNSWISSSRLFMESLSFPHRVSCHL